MTKHRIFAMTAIAVAMLAGCAIQPANNEFLDQARSAYRAAQDNPQTRELASGELKVAGDALTKANEAWTRGDKSTDVDHLAYLAKQRVAIAQETGQQKAAELAVTNADSARNKVRLASRTEEADKAHQSADAAKLDADAAKLRSEASQRDADAAKLQSEAAQRDTVDAKARNEALEAQLRDLNAKKTDRGLVITIGDVLFDTDKAQLKSVGILNVEKLVAFLKAYPQRTARIEGFTDSTGSASHNQELSVRRAESVRNALLGMGIGRDRLTAQGYGEASPVAGNDSASGRQMNRRVEIILSEDDGITSR